MDSGSKRNSSHLGVVLWLTMSMVLIKGVGGVPAARAKCGASGTCFDLC